MLHRRLASKSFLVRRRILNENQHDCPFCSHVEDLEHAIFHCSESRSIWIHLFSWVEISLTMPLNAVDFFNLWRGFFCPGVYRDFATTIWLFICWTLWMRINEKIFQGADPRPFSLHSAIYQTWFLFNCNNRLVSSSRRI